MEVELEGENVCSVTHGWTPGPKELKFCRRGTTGALTHDEPIFDASPLVCPVLRIQSGVCNILPHTFLYWGLAPHIDKSFDMPTLIKPSYN